MFSRLRLYLRITFAFILWHVEAIFDRRRVERGRR